jgi:hypothetical protein
MKSANYPLKSPQKIDKKLLKSFVAAKQYQLEKNNRRLRMVKSVVAGHVRGGHSFH